MFAKLFSFLAVKGLFRNLFAELLAVLTNLVDELEDREKYNGDQEKVDNGVDECAPIDVDRLLKVDLLRDRNTVFIKNVLVDCFEIGVSASKMVARM